MNTISLTADGTTAEFAVRGAELRSWRVGSRELIWQRDPAWWSESSPVLFPIVGQVAGGEIRVNGRAYPMARHGFARQETFQVVDRSERTVRFRLVASERTLPVFPFDFRVDLVATLSATPAGSATLSVDLVVANPGGRDLPYAVGWHPAFPWPLDGDDPAGHAVVFQEPEDPAVPDVTGEGLLNPGSRRMPLEGRWLPLTTELFGDGALIVIDANSRSLRYSAPNGSALEYTVDDFPHFGLWTRPGAPYLSIEALTGYSDPEGFHGDVFARASQRRLAPGEMTEHRVVLTWRPAP